MAGYNYFRERAIANLFLLLMIQHPTPEQREQAERVIDCIERYTASKA